MLALGDFIRDDASEVRLPDTGLPHDQNRLSLSGFRGVPFFHHAVEFWLTAHEAGEIRSARRVEPACHIPNPVHAIQADFLVEAGECPGGQFGHVEGFSDQIPCPGRNHHLIGIRALLQPGGEVRRFSGDRAFLASRTAEIPDNHIAGRDRDAATDRTGIAGGQCPDHLDCLEPRPDGALGLVLECGWPSEEGHHAVAQILREMSAIARDGAGDAILVIAQQLAHVLGIELTRQARRSHHVTEKYGNKSALGLLAGIWHRRLVGIVGQHRWIGVWL